MSGEASIARRRPRGRWWRWPLTALGVLVGVVALLVLIGGIMAAIQGRPPFRGEFVDIGGRRLRLVCEGPPNASPVVWFEHGAFGQAEDFSAIQRRLTAQGVRSCAYDRAGMGLSDPGPAPRDGDAVYADRTALIRAAGVKGPFVVAGHSFGGIHARRWAAEQPDQVVGLVLLDAGSPEALLSPGAETWVGRFARVGALASGAASLGLMRPLGWVTGDPIGLPPADARVKAWAFSSPAHNRGAAAEVALTLAAARQAVAAGPLQPELPVAVVAAGPLGEGAWAEAKVGPARNSRFGSIDAVEGASHASMLGETHADRVVTAIMRVVDASRAAADAPR